MGLEEALAGRRAAVLDRWFAAVLATYPEQTAKFVASVADPFANPVGGAVRESLGRLVDLLPGPAAPPELAAALDGVVRIRAVQEFAPSAAVGFVQDLRGILREELAGAGLAAAELAALDAAVDRMLLAAFDVYMRCREKIFEIRVREVRDSLVPAGRARVAQGASS